MSKYIIVEKSTKGNKQNCECIVKYQVDGFGSAIFETVLLCVKLRDFNKPQYLFASSKIGEHLDNVEDREAFLLELEKFQRGGSYRRANPIKKSQSMILKEKKRKLETDLSNLDRKIREVENIERQQAFKSYKEGIDYDTLIEYTNGLAEIINSNDHYYVKPIMHIWDGYKLEIWDRKLNKPVYMGVIDSDNKINFRDLEDYEIKM